MISKVKMVPGSLTPKEVKNYTVMAEKFCIGCGCKLDHWGKYAYGDRHSQYCSFRIINDGSR